MRSRPLLAGVALAFQATFAAAAAAAAEGTSPLRYSVTAAKKRATSATLRRRNNDDDVVTLTNRDLGTSYSLDLGIGNPPQKVTVNIDTGSSGLWVNPTCTLAHLQDDAGNLAKCEGGGSYSHSLSTTSNPTQLRNTLLYGKGNVTIQWVADSVMVGSAVVSQQMFGEGIDSYELSLGFLGLGPPLDYMVKDYYPLLLDNLASQGLINSRAFSLDLRDIDDPSGSLIFGGIDTGKFEGELHTLPIIQNSSSPDGLNRYWVTLDSIDMSFSNTTKKKTGVLNNPTAVVLDSGATLTYLPYQTFMSLGEAFPNATYSSSDGGPHYWIVDCDTVRKDTSGGSVDFNFGSKVISVPYWSLVYPIYSGSDEASEDSSNAAAKAGDYRDFTCVLGVQPLEGVDAARLVPLLADSFLRAAYLVFDVDNQKIHIAQAANCGAKLVDIGSGKDAVPSSSGCLAPTASATATRAAK